MEKNLYALIIGINDYPVPAHQLEGCVPDAKEFQRFLEHHCKSQGIKFHPKTLFNKEASRQNIIDAFAHFGAAEDGSTCVFFYSGHGSQMKSPPEFWEDNDRRLESMVCWDSRIKNGRDLTDKELAYLMWKYTKKDGKNIHLVNIFDCCHSGSISRGTEREPDPVIRSRMAETNPTKITIEDLEGHKEYLRKGGGLVPPVADYITLSAARSYESAYEMHMNGMPRGIFTNSLLDVLENSNLSFITYGELISRVQTRVHNLNTEYSPQHPLISVYGNLSENTLFLNGQMSKSPRSYLKHDVNKGWILDMGQMHSVISGGELILEDGNVDRETTIKSVKPGYSVAEEQSWMDKNKGEYLIKSLELDVKKLKVGFHPDLKKEQVDALKKEMEESEKLELDQANAKYWMHVMEDRGYVLLRAKEAVPLFEAVPLKEENSEDASSIQRFIDNVEKVARWEEVSELSNPLAKYSVDNLVEIEWDEVLDLDDDGNATETDKRSIDKEEVFSYTFEEDEWWAPAFRLRINNISGKDLWIGALYLSEDFSITDSFLPMEELANGASPRHFIYDGGNAIELFLPDELYKWGVTEVVNKIKILISTEEFSLREFNQDGLKFEPLVRTRGTAKGGGGGSRRKKKGPQWVVKDLNLRIHRPLESEGLPEGKSVTVQGVTIEATPGFSAKGIQLATSSQAARSIGVGGAPVLAFENVFPVNLGSSRNTGQPLDVIELHKVQGAENINADQPLKFKINKDLGDGASVLPLGLDKETGLYFPLGYMDKEGVVRIEQMPDATEPTSRGFVNSFKIYLKGVFYEKVLQQKDPYPVLAIAETPDLEGDVVYTSDTAMVTSKVKEANTILVMVHGLIGDTSDKAKIMRRATRDVNGESKDLTSVYDLLLTFDYESLSVPIEQTASDLKTKLESVGVKPGHGKTVHLIAHSMGGLVSRWYLEKEGGDQVITHFIQVGSPNLGSPWAKAYDWLNFGLGKLINFLPIPSTINQVFGYLGKVKEDIEVTTKQLQPESDFLKLLNTNAKAPIPYTIIPGNSDLIPDRDEREQKLVKRYLSRFKDKYRDALENMFFKEKSDDIVSMSSMQGVPEGASIAPRKLDAVGCDHFAYFKTDPGIELIGEVLFALHDE